MKVINYSNYFGWLYIHRENLINTVSGKLSLYYYLLEMGISASTQKLNKIFSFCKISKKFEKGFLKINEKLNIKSNSSLIKLNPLNKKLNYF